MRILSLHPHLDGNPLWASRTTDIRTYDPKFFGRSVLRRLWTLRRAFRNGHYDATVFSPVFNRGFVLAAALVARRYRALTVFAESYLAFGTAGWRARRRLGAYRFLLRFADLVTAQSTFERGLYEQAFGTRVRCRFVPWYSAEPSRPIRHSQWVERWRNAVVLCPGRYRDVTTFVDAVRGLRCHAVIACGRDDLSHLVDLPVQRGARHFQLALDHHEDPDQKLDLDDGRGDGQNVEVHVGLSYPEYLALFERAAIVVLPFHESRTLRSLGHVAYFAAAIRAVPLLTTPTPHLADYAVSADEIMTFKAGDARDLRAKIERLLADPRAAWRLARRARRGARGRFTAQRHIATLLQEIDRLAEERRAHG